jgi:hypothetical protein
MKKTLIAVALSVAATGAMAGSNVKAGLWEVRATKQVMDGQDMMAEMAAMQAQMQQMMAKAGPAQKKQMESMMGRQAATGGNVHRVCISPEMAARDQAMFTSDQRCEPTKTSQSGNRATYEFNCSQKDGTTMVGKGESIFSGDTVSSKVDMVMTGPRGKHTMQTESQMKYLGPDCQGLKPADQIAREMQARNPAARGK